MKKLHYTINTLEPLIITQHSDDPNMYETLQYIRGTVIQGIFAQRYLENTTADSEFTRLIVSGDCIFSNTFPIEKGKTFVPAPIALVQEKYHPEKAYNLLASSFPPSEQTKGISSLVNIESNQISPLTIRKEIRLHNQIDKTTRISKDGKLFNYQSLPAGVVFKGTITLKEDSDENTIKSLLPSGTSIRIGRSATSEYGKVCFEWIDSIEDEKTSETGQVIMTLLSDTIIYNNNGFSSLATDDLNNYLNDSIIERSISRKMRIEGFLNVWKLRKPSENVFAAGSSFLLDQRPLNYAELTNLGLGERTHEGYGQVSFTLLNTTSNILKFCEWKEQKLDKPLFAMPTLTTDIWDSICLKRAKEEAVRKALDDANKTQPGISSNHLLGKLKAMAFEPEMFGEFLNDLRPTAKNHLTKSYVLNKNLVEYFQAVLSDIIKIHKPKQDVDFSQHEDEIRRLYFEQYFNQLRRNNINTEKDEKR